MSKVPSLKLNNGALMPQLGLGTWQSKKGLVAKAVKHAISNGYRHIDAAWIYKNEEEVGEGIKNALEEHKIAREDIFVTTKLWNTFHKHDDVENALKDSLKILQLDYVDLYLIHWPFNYKNTDSLWPKEDEGLWTEVSFAETWSALEECVNKGLTKSIGLSNFNSNQIQQILNVAKIRPSVLQIESHPHLRQDELYEFCRSNDIQVTAYSPLGSPGTFDGKPNLLENEHVVKLAKKYNVEPAQILIRYQLDRGFIVIPKSTTPSRIESNFNVFGFKLTNDDLKTLSNFEQIRYCGFVQNENHPQYGFTKTEAELKAERANL